MPEIRETRLPGVGIRFDFVTSAGERIGVVAHRGGRRELMICGADDPDTCRDVVRLEEDDVRALVDVLGAAHVTEEIAHMRLSQEGLAIDWLPVRESSACASCTVHDVEHRDESAAAVVAVIREGATIAAPPSDFALRPGDIAVAVGTPDGVSALFALLQGTPAP